MDSVALKQPIEKRCAMLERSVRTFILTAVWFASTAGAGAENEPDWKARSEAALQKKITLTFDRINLTDLTDRVGTLIDMPVRIETRDLQIAGITLNQAMSIAETDQTAERCLAAVFLKANPAGQLVYVVKPGTDNRGSIVVCTRQGAKQRKEELPKLFQIKAP
jgi:hypothetical protein